MKTSRVMVVCARILALAFFVNLASMPAIGAVVDDFESYAVGSDLHGQGDWAGWAGDPSAGALVSTVFSFSPTRAVNVTGATDLVRTFSGITNGQWVFKVMQYIPSTSSGTNYVILLNRYQFPFAATNLNWSVQFQNDFNTGQIISDLGGGATLPLVKDQWVEIRVEINLASNTVAEFYNGQPLSTHAWQDGTGLSEIQAFDLFAAGSGPAYYDNLSLSPISPPPALALSFTAPSSFNEFNRQAVLEWNGEAGKTYVIQSAGDLASPDLWKDTDLVTRSATGPIRWMSPEAVTEQKYYRLVLPQPTAASVTPTFINSGDPSALFYVQGQCLPTNGSVVINGQNFSVVSFDPNGAWLAVSLNGLPPGTSVIGNILVLDSGSNVVTTLPLQNPVHYGTEMTTEQLQGSPTEPPASPAALAIWASKKGYDYYQAQSAMASAGANNNPFFQENDNQGQMVGDRRAHHLSKKGYDYYQTQSAIRSGGGLDDDDDGDGFEPSATLLMPALMKAKEKANRTKCANTLRVAPATGEVQGEETDVFIPGRGLDFVWTRTYRSRTGPNSAQGAGWDFSYNVSLTPQPDGTAQLCSGNGRCDTFYPNGTNGWFRDEFFLHIGDVDRDGAPDLVTFPDTGRWVFNPQVGSPAPGKLAQIIDRNGNTISLHYDAAGRLDHIVDDLDRTNTIAYNPVGLIASVTDFSGRTVQYEYDGNGDLTAVISPPVTGTPNGNDFPGGKTNRFTYTSGYPNPAQNHLMLTSVDGRGQVTHQHVYQHNQSNLDFLRCISVQRGTNPPVDLTYLTVAPSPSNGFAATKVILRDASGNVAESFHDSRQRCVRLVEYTGRAPSVTSPTTETANRPVGKLRGDDPDFFETRFEWNEDSLCTRVVYPRGDSEEMVYQRAFNQNASRSNKSGRHHAGDLRVHRQVACCDMDDDGDGLVDTRVSTFDYDPRFGSPPVFATAGGIKVKHKGWDGLIYHRIRPKGWDGTVKGSTASARVIMDRDSGRSKGFGFVTLATDPRGIITTCEYDAKGNPTRETVRNNFQLGSLAVEDFFAYNAHGQLTAITNAPDANGRRRVDAFEYYTNGPMAGFVRIRDLDANPDDGLRLTTIYEYDVRGNPTNVMDARGNIFAFVYNALDQCVSGSTPPDTTYPEIVWRVELYYDENNRLIRCDADNRNEAGSLDGVNPQWTTLFAYDSFGRCIEVAGEIAESGGKASFATNRFFYDSNDNLVAAHTPVAVTGEDPNNTVAFEYDERGLLYREMSAPGAGNAPTNQYDYTPNGACSKVNKIESFTIKQSIISYDAFHRPVSVTGPMSNVLTYTYDRNDNLTRVQVFGQTNDVPGNAGSRLLAETRYSYDFLDRCVQQVDSFFDVFAELPVGDGQSVTVLSYAPNGACSSVTDDNGQTTRYAYDTAGRLSSITDPKTNVTSYTYDPCGNVLSTTQTDRSDLSVDTQQFSVVSGYDKLHRLTRSVDNVGNTNLYAYDSRNNLVRHTDPKGNDTTFAYDGLSRRVTTVAYDGLASGGITINTSHVEYDVNDRAISTTDANTNSTIFAYDSLDRCVQITHADGTHRNLVWSPRSNLVWEQDANGNVISNSFDLLERCVRRDIAPGSGVAATTTFEVFAHDGLSQLVAATNDISYTVVRRDSLGNRTHVVTDGWQMLCAYDGVGNVLSQTYPSGRLVTYTYDGLDQIASMSSGTGGLPPTTLATYAYEGAGRLGRISRANNVNSRLQWNGLVNPPNTTGDFGFGQVSGINHQVAGGGAVLDRRFATYDRNQNKTARLQTSPFGAGGRTTTNTFAYDALDRLVGFTRASGTPADLFRAYSLDANGNRLLASSNGVVSPYVMDATFPDPADLQLNQYTLTPFVLAPEQYDQNGNLIGRVTASAQLQYVYDFADRLVAVNDLAMGFPSPVATYAYDALGRRLGKTIHPPAPQLPVTTQYIYDGRDDDCDGVIEEHQNGMLKRTYVFPHVFDQKGRVMFTDTGDAFHFLCDDLDNTLALVDAGGNVVERCDYDDYGAPILLSPDGFPTGEKESGAGNPYLFQGLEWDPETGLYHMGGDYLDPQTGGMRKRPGRVKYGDITLKRGYASGSTFAGGNPWSGGGAKVQDHNSSRSNKSSSRAQDHNSSRSNKSSTKAQDHNSSRSNKTASSFDLGGGGTGLIVPVAMDKGLRFRAKQDVYVWKLKAKKDTYVWKLAFPDGASMLGGVLPGGAILSAALREEGGRHTPFQNKYRPQCRSHTTVSNVLKAKHDAAMAAIQNIR